MFTSPTQAKLQEIGPRFTLKLRWLKKGLPSVTAPDGRIANGGDANEGLEADNAEVARQEKMDEDEAMGEMGKAPPAAVNDQPVIPPLDQEQEYEWKWKVSHTISHRRTHTDFSVSAQDGGFSTYVLLVDFCVHVSYPFQRVRRHQRCMYSALTRSSAEVDDLHFAHPLISDHF